VPRSCSVGSADSYLHMPRGGREFTAIYTTTACMDVGIKLEGDEPTDRAAWQRNNIRRIRGLNA